MNPFELPPAPRRPAAPTPRRAVSARRTSTIDMTWPGGWGTQLLLIGRARDIVTRPGGVGLVVTSQANTTVGIGTDREIESIEASPSPQGLERLLGARGGGHLRRALDEVLPEERRNGTPLALLLDDVSGASLIAGFAWSRWNDRWMDGPDGGPRPRRQMIGICSGFRPGSSALDVDGSSTRTVPHNVSPVGSLVDPLDIEGWHELPRLPPVSMRRARRIDVTIGQEIEIDAMFRDTARVPDGGQVAIHEYHIVASADLRTGTLSKIVADPRGLPYRECPAAASNVDRLVGRPLAELRSAVLEVLRTTDSCTHLNDALRSLADVPALVATLAP